MDADRLARWYRWIEYASFGHALERARFAFLPKLADAEDVLVLGEGDGRALQQLLACAPKARVDVIESSAEMIGMARERVAESGRVRFFRDDARTASLPGGRYDAVVTFFFLDCFTEPELQDLLKRIENHLADGAIWLVSDFAIRRGWWGRWHDRAWIWLMYRFFRFTTGLHAQRLPPIERLLSEIGLHPTDFRRSRLGMIFSEMLVYRPENRRLITAASTARRYGRRQGLPGQ